MTASALELAGILGACGAAAAAIVLRDRRARLTAMAVALVIAPILVAGDVWSEARVIDFRHSPAQIGGALVVGAIALTALVLAFRRWPLAFPVAAVAVLPLRVPLEIGDETANLLVPLYLVITAGLIVSSVTPTTNDERRTTSNDPWPQRLRWLLAATLVLYAIQASYSEDVANAIENLGFFLVPFAVMFTLLVEVEWTRRLLRTTLFAVGLVAVGCALVGIYQYFARDLFLNPELFDANELHVYFRVNSHLLRPEHLRPLSGARADGARRLPSLGRRPPRPRARRGRLRDRARRARVQLLDDQLRRPARRPRHRGAAALELARRGCLRRVRAGRRWPRS